MRTTGLDVAAAAARAAAALPHEVAVVRREPRPLRLASDPNRWCHRMPTRHCPMACTVVPCYRIETEPEDHS